MGKGNVPPAAVQVAKERAKPEDEAYILSTGIPAILRPVASSLIDEVTSRIKDPEIPMWMNESKGVEEPNPSDPRYLAAMAEAEANRGSAGLDAMLMFGIELVDGLPDDDLWIRKLQYLNIEVSEDPFEREFLYKKYVAVSNDDLRMLGALSGVSQEAIDEAMETFQGTSGR